MTRGKIISISIILILAIAIGIFWFSSRDANESNNNVDNNDRGFLGIFPSFGGKDDTQVSVENIVNTDENIDENKQIVEEELDVPKFRQISFKPVSGFVVFENNSSTTVRFLEKETGHIFEAYTDNLEVKRLSNTTIPGIREVLWSGDGSVILMRYLDDQGVIQSFVANLEKNEDDEFYSINSSVLSENITSVDGFGKTFFGIVDKENSSEWTIYSPLGNKEVLVNSPFREWLVQFWSSNKASLQFKSSFGYGSSLYFLDLNNINLVEVLENIPGLSSLTSPSGDFVIYSSSLEGSLITNVLSVENRQTSILEIKTLADKCIWANNKDIVYCAVPKFTADELPDSWYRGEVSFDDSFWSVDIDSGEVIEIFDPNTENFKIDVYSLKISPDDKSLFFINKKDGTFWSLSLEKPLN